MQTKTRSTTFEQFSVRVPAGFNAKLEQMQKMWPGGVKPPKVQIILALVNEKFEKMKSESK